MPGVEEGEGVGRYNGSFTTERFNCPCFVVGGHSTSSTRSTLCVPRLNSYFLSLSLSLSLPRAHSPSVVLCSSSLPPGATFCRSFYPPSRSLPRFSLPFSLSRPRSQGTTARNAKPFHYQARSGSLLWRRLQREQRVRKRESERERGKKSGVAGGGGEGRTKHRESKGTRDREKRIQMVGMNPLCGRMADNAPLYLVAGANSYRFVIDSYNGRGICHSYLTLALPPPLSLFLISPSACTSVLPVRPIPP